MTNVEDKLLTRAYCDEIEDYAVPYVLSPWNLVIRPDLSERHHRVMVRQETYVVGL